MKTDKELKEKDNTKMEHKLLAFAGCLCIVSGLISFVSGNPVSGWALIGLGLADIGVVLSYHDAEKNKNV